MKVVTGRRRASFRVMLCAFAIAAPSALWGCVGSAPDQFEADMAVCNAMIPTSLPTTDELVAKGPAYSEAFFKALTLARRQEDSCREHAFLAADRRDAATAATLDSLRELGNGLSAAGAALSRRPLSVSIEPPPPPPAGIPLSSLDHTMSEVRKPEPPPWCRPDSPFSHTTACPAP
jgi:hypothetical protein